MISTLTPNPARTFKLFLNFARLRGFLVVRLNKKTIVSIFVIIAHASSEELNCISLGFSLQFLILGKETECIGGYPRLFDDSSVFLSVRDHFEKFWTII